MCVVRCVTCAFGKRLLKGPTNTLCSYAKEGSMMTSTGSPSSLTSWMHSLQGKHLEIVQIREVRRTAAR